MIVVPAIDLRDGCCVQLVGGDYDRELVRLQDPVDVARAWRERGAAELHVVDLDAATGRGSNAAAAASICGLTGVAVHAGGGVRDTAAVVRLLDAGARSVVVGTRAVTEPAWLAEVTAAHPGRITLAVDVRAGEVTTQGWTASTGADPLGVVAAAPGDALFGIVVTAVDVEGSGRGPDLVLASAARAVTGHRLAYAGGIASAADVRALAARGVDAVVVGTALYTGALVLEGLIEELQP